MQHITFIVSLYSAICIHWAECIDWCKLDCATAKNTMCEYKPQTQIGDCRNIMDSNTPQKRKEILRLHNEYRDKIAGGKISGWPKAANMRQLEWDNALEQVALRWAQQCKHGHDVCRRTPDFVAVGQNYGMEANSAYFIESSKPSFEGWVQEIQLADPSIINSFRSGGWNHFTQVIWARTHRVGCAQVHFVEKQTGQGLAIDWMRTVAICNYGTMGNIIAEPVYEKGDPCTKCPAGTKCSSAYPNLCAPHVERNGGLSASGIAPMVFSYLIVILNKNLICL